MPDWKRRDATWGGTGSVAIDPVASTLLNAKMPNGQYLIPSSQSSATYTYGVPNVYLIGTARMSSDLATLSLDYDATPTDRVSAKYFYQTAPVTRPFGFSETAGFPTTAHNGSQVFSLGAASRFRSHGHVYEL